MDSALAGKLGCRALPQQTAVDPGARCTHNRCLASNGTAPATQAPWRRQPHRRRPDGLRRVG